VVFTNDGQELVSGGMDKTVKVWEAKTGGKVLKTLNHPAAVHCVALSPDGQHIASAGSAPEGQAHVIVWDFESGKEIVDLKGHTDIVHTVAFHPTENRLASCGKDTTIRVWDLEKKEELYQDKHRDEVMGIAYDGEGKALASASAEIIFLWVATPKK
jgi:WD40 repeat protein